MISSEVQRTLVKSPPELWAELSDPASLARHLSELGEVRVTRVEPERTVEWEAESASGKVELAPSGWGTKVLLSLSQEAPAAVPAASEPAEPRRSLFARLFRRRAAAPRPAVPEQRDLAAELRAAEEEIAAQGAELLTGVLDRLGAAHHRPFSRS